MQLWRYIVLCEQTIFSNYRMIIASFNIEIYRGVSYSSLIMYSIIIVDWKKFGICYRITQLPVVISSTQYEKRP